MRQPAHIHVQHFTETKFETQGGRLLVLISILGWTILTHVLYGQERQSAKPNPSDSNTEELQKATQNPVASLISVPFQNNTDLNIGPFARDKSTLNVQPVIPMKLNESWNLIARIITPLLFQPDVSQAHLGTFGLGDIQPTFFLSPAKPHKLIWGVGPALLLPTATDDNLGTGKWAAGPAVVVLLQPGKWTVGALVSNLWSFAGLNHSEGGPKRATNIRILRRKTTSNQARPFNLGGHLQINLSSCR